MYQYDEAHAAYYDYHSKGVAGDLGFFVEEAVRAGSPVLELGCGTGRVTAPIAEAGVDVVGLDNSAPMLSAAREKIERLDANVAARIELVEADMVDFALGREFKLIIVPFRAFQHVLTSEEQRRTLACIREHLTDDGRLIFNVFDPRLQFLSENAGQLGAPLKKTSEFVNDRTGRKVCLWQTCQYDLEAQILSADFIFEEVDDAGRSVSRTFSPLTMRWLYRYETQYLLELCGFKVEALYGDFSRGEFRYGGEQIWVASRG